MEPLPPPGAPGPGRLTATGFALLGLALVGYCLIVFLFVASAPYTGFYSYTGEQVASVDPGTPAALAGLARGDRILRIGAPPGRPVVHYFDLQTTLKPGDTQWLEVRPGGEAPPRWLSLPVERHPFPGFLLAALLATAVLASLAFALFRGRPADPVARRFYLLALATLATSFGSFYWYVLRVELSLIALTAVAAAAMPALTLSFGLRFPEPSPWLARRWHRLLYLPAPLLFAAELALALTDSYTYAHGYRHRLVHPAWVATAYAHFLYFALALALATANLSRTYRRTTDPARRAQVRWMRWGALCSLAPFLLCLSLAARDFESFVMGQFRPWFLLSVACLLLSSILAIKRTRLADVDHLFKRALFSLLLHAGLIALCLAALLVLPAPSRASGPLIAWGLALAALFWIVVPARNRALAWLGRRYALGRYRYERALAGLSEIALERDDLRALAGRLLDHLIAALGVESLALLIGEPALLFLRTPGPASRWEIALPEDHPLLERYLSAPSPRGPAPGETGPLDAGAGPPLRAALTCVLQHHGEALGALLVGGRRDGLPFEAQEREQLRVLANQMAAALHAAAGNEELRRSNVALEEKIVKIEAQQGQILVLQERLQDENRRMREEIAAAPGGAGEIIGSSAAIAQLREQVARTAPTGSAVLITGESGTGKELVARALHQSSPRRANIFLAVNAAALPQELIESELFGHERGAFTGADRARAGKFELADGGTIFLDEIGELSLQAQVRLLRVLQEREITRVGGSRPLSVDLRVIAATNRDIEAEVRAGRFREDLFFRLNVIRIHTPPLRERRDDLFELSLHILEKKSRETGKRLLRLEEPALEQMQRYRWPGNVRELENVLERALVLAEGEALTSELLGQVLPQPEAPATGGSGTEGEEALFAGTYEDFERRLLRHALRRADGNKAGAARLLGLKRTTFLQKCRRYGVAAG